jgi:signal transduction histidine kinase
VPTRLDIIAARARLGGWLAAVAGLLVLALAPAAAPAQSPPAVLVLLSGAPDNTLELQFFEGLHAELRLARPLPAVPHSLHVNFLDLVRFAPREGYEADLAGWLASKYRDRRFDVIVTNGLPALRFALAHRDLWPGAELLFAGVQAAQLPPDATALRGATIAWDVDGTIDLARALLPRARRIVLIAGTSSVERALLAQARAALAARGSPLEVEELSGVPWDDILRRIASLPPDTFILPLGLAMDPQGRPVDPVHALRLGLGVARAPTFNLNETGFGFGVVGGSLIDFRRVGADAARRTVALLQSPASAAAIEPLVATQRRVDARALERWGIAESRVPVDTEILFRRPTLWRDFRTQVLLTLATLTVLSACVFGLLLERRRRRHAERQARDRLAQVARMDRIGALGQLSVSLAHEINQPLGSARNYVEAAQRLLAGEPLRVDRLEHALGAIRRDCQRAADVLDRVRGMFGAGAEHLHRVDLAAIVAQTVELVRAEAERRGVALAATRATMRPLYVDGDPVQLQQAALNLLLNALDAAGARPGGHVAVHVASDGGSAQVDVTDDGPDVAPSVLERMFEPFFTTKAQGMGMGLALVRTIVEGHSGRVSVRRDPGGPTILSARLPLSSTGAAAAIAAEPA